MQNNGGFSSIGIAGIGLIGGSLAKAFAGIGIKVYGYDGSRETLEASGLSGVFDAVTDEFDTFVDLAPDLIYVCLPVKASVDFIVKLGKAGVKSPVTDSASTKSSVMKAALEAGLEFCGGHPVRGKETSGFANSEAGLFHGAIHILTPLKGGCLPGRLLALHESIGMKVSLMDMEEHDKILAAVSHLPHVAAFCLMDMVEAANPDAFKFIGGGFRDFTRIAASDPVMWADIFTDNKMAVIKSIDLFTETVEKWRSLIETGDYEGLRQNILNISNLRRTL